MTTRTDPRYGSRRWQRVREAVLRRDRYRCQVVEGCATRASVADHVVPVTASTSDAMFYGLHNLRAACRSHNLARALAPELEGRGTAVVAKDYSR